MALGWHRLALAAALVVAGCGDEQRPGDASGSGPVRVATWNVLHGARFDRLAGAEPAEIPLALDGVWSDMEAGDPVARMRAVAAEIAAARPDLVGLQEAARWRAEPRDGAAPVEYDLAALVVAELRARGAAYAVAAEADASDVVLPGARASYRLTDRVVILAREGLALSNARAGRYDTRLPLPFPIPGGVSSGVPRAWASVDVGAGRPFRFVCTHLETVHAVSAGQAAELVEVAGESLPVILVGDLNSAPGDPAYELLVNGPAGFRDAWEAGEGDGLTCCRAALDDPGAALSSRVDLVLLRGFAARAAERLGASEASFQGGRWPSDHAGVAATLDPDPAP